MDNIDMKSLKSEWEGDEKLHRQFGSFENFVSYRAAGVEGELFVDRSCCFSDGTGDVSVEMAVKFDETTAADAQLKEHFSQTQELKDQFSGSECYLALVHHQRRESEREAQRAGRRERKELRAQRIRELVDSK